MSYNFTDEQKVILTNQLSILEKLAEMKQDKEQVEKYKNGRLGIMMGYNDEALELLDIGFSPDVSDETKNFVYDVLSMYNFIYGIYESLNEAQKAEIGLDNIKFIGFDNHEATYGFYKFVTESLGKYADVTDFIKRNSWEDDSHGFDGGLKPMVDVFKSFDSNDFLSDSGKKLQMIKEILSAK